jgi:uncharacterized membrane protein SpoIIM required for sporulation
VTSAQTKQITRDVGRVPQISVGILIGILLFGLFIVSYDEGHLFSIAQGDSAYEKKWMHDSHEMVFGFFLLISLINQALENLLKKEIDGPPRQFAMSSTSSTG